MVIHFNFFYVYLYNQNSKIRTKGQLQDQIKTKGHSNKILFFPNKKKKKDGICSYHVFKPNTEEFPFTIDIKDKATGEAIIEVIRKELESLNAKNAAAAAAPSSPSDTEVSQPAIFNTVNSRNTNANDPHLKAIVLDCNKRKEFNFLIQAHDCSTPSLASRKIPVKIQVVDHDDYALKFEREDVYRQTLVESDSIYESFAQVRARDKDCTNNGYACAYKLLLNDLNEVDANFPFKIDAAGSLSSVRAVKAGEFYEFKVRAFDCVSKEAYVDAEVIVNVIEPCIPQFFDYASEVVPALDQTTSLGNCK